MNGWIFAVVALLALFDVYAHWQSTQRITFLESMLFKKLDALAQEWSEARQDVRVERTFGLHPSSRPLAGPPDPWTKEWEELYG
jgi:hypothetical protein